jgi:mannonate dehydratase
MHRREWLRRTTAGAGLAGLPLLAAVGQGAPLRAAQQPPAGDRNPAPLRILDIRTILTAPAGIRLVVVKVLTSEPGLYGLGCATFTQRPRVVETAIERYLKPFLVGKDPMQIEDIYQSSFVSSYWRNGPVLNNALSGVDMALWDLLGKRARMPVYQLLGGKCRHAVDTYRHASGARFQDVEKAVRGFMDRGYRHVRVQVAIPGQATYGAGRPGGDPKVPLNRRTETWEPAAYVRTIPRLFEHLRKAVGDQVELLHDTHERVPPILAMKLAKDLEPFRPFFLEDPFSPEDVGYFERLRQQTCTPIAMGELFNNPNEWLSLISNRLIDFIRVHLSQVGGLTVARKLAALCEFFNVPRNPFRTVPRDDRHNSLRFSRPCPKSGAMALTKPAPFPTSRTIARVGLNMDPAGLTPPPRHACACARHAAPGRPAPRSPAPGQKARIRRSLLR